jgi:hypothetical protein
MKPLSILIIALISVSSFADKVIDCSQLKSNMETLCAPYLEERCNIIPDCFKRRDTCGKGGAPQSPSECVEFNACNKAVVEQNPQSFHQRKACRYEWTQLKDSSRNWCGVKGRWGLKEAACPGYRSVGTFFKNLVSPHVDSVEAGESALDENYQCANLKKYYQASLLRCEGFRRDFKKTCMVKGSEEDLKAYEKSAPPKCVHYEQISKYLSGKTMALDVKLDSVDDSARRAKRDVSDEGVTKSSGRSSQVKSE